jgi:hypothetical protein
VEEFFSVVWILVLVAIVIVVFVAQANASKKLDETYRRVAQVYGGRCITGGAFSRPSLSFHHQGTLVSIDIQATGGKHKTYYTQVHLAWPDKTTRCEIYPERFTSRLGKMLGMTDVEIGSPDFDRDFIIAGNTVRNLRELLRPEVQADIYRLRRLLHNDHVYVSIGGGRMLIKKLGLIRDAAKLSDLIEASLDLYDRALGVTGEGIEIVSPSEGSSQGEVVCQICGETITAELVHCRRCKTPHHEDCWQYFGGCSTFGCGEKRYVAPKI